MKKIVCWIAAVVVAAGLVGCSAENQGEEIQPEASKESQFEWDEADFAFYDEDGNPELFPTVDQYWVTVSEDDGTRTNRGIAIGDHGSNIAEAYDLKDFEWSITSWTDEAAADALESEYIEKRDTIDDIMLKLTEIAAQGLDAYIWCDVYKQNGNLCSISDLDMSEMDAIEEFAGWSEEDKND